ncbi:acyl-CoA/acyl-ACP dehydrogenase [Archangium violaceum]|uniref:acyl-CoA dehydrogenase family protein n=1 Tax=Archangium violaceum TaxID=83451 RepID=UPI00194DC6EE|nr:acyl-CoA dehydrogenase family protein [Archangium violaceum]QRO01009.1 acyl-CoA/acyl-ACP dehydrogenase [Archangium violaceum]
MSTLNRGPEVFDHSHLEVSPGEKELITVARRLAYENFGPRAERYDAENRFPTENFEDLQRHGLMALRVPKQYGGQGASSLTQAAVTLEVAKGDPATALCFTMHNTAMTFIDLLATPEQKERFFGRVVREGVKFSALGSEPQASIFSGNLPKTVLTRTQGGYLLRGRKAYCSFGPNADLAFVNAMLGEALVGVVVPLTAPSIRFHSDWNTLAMRGTQSVSIDFEDTFIPEQDVITTPLNLLLELEYGVGLCAAYLGVAESAYRYARELARETMKRTLEGEAGHGHPDAGRLFSTVGEMKISLEPAWLMLKRAALMEPVGSFERTWALAEAKYVVGEMAAKMAQQSIRVAGAKALSRAFPIERLFRDAQAGLVMAIKPDHAAYLAGRFELGVLPSGMTLAANPTGFALSPEDLPQSKVD